MHEMYIVLMFGQLYLICGDQCITDTSDIKRYTTFDIILYSIHKIYIN